MRRRLKTDIVSASLSEIILFFLFFFLILLGGQLTLAPIKGGLIENADANTDQDIEIILTKIEDLTEQLEKAEQDKSDDKQTIILLQGQKVDLERQLRAARGKTSADRQTIILLRGQVEGLIRTIDEYEKSREDKWPPAITLDDRGYRFETGKSFLSLDFRRKLRTSAIPRLREILRDPRYDITVIEVVGHTDERPIGELPPGQTRRNKPYSNLDDELLDFLQLDRSAQDLTASDNTGLAMARAAAVVAFIKAETDLALTYQILPLSAGQTVDRSNRLAVPQRVPRDERERRRIEIRVRGDFARN